MKTMNISQSSAQFSSQSPLKKKPSNPNLNDSNHLKNTPKPSSSQKLYSPAKNPYTPDKKAIPQPIQMNKQSSNIGNHYESPNKTQGFQRKANKCGSLTLQPSYQNINPNSGSKKKIDDNSSVQSYNPMFQSNNEYGQFQKQFQNGKSQQISTINSIPNISFTNGMWTTTEFGSQIFGSHEQVAEKIIEICTQKIEEDPNNLKLYQKRLQQYQKTGEYENAISDANYILQREPQNTFALFSRGNVYMQQGEIEQALSDFELILQIDPDNVNAALTKANCLNIKGDYHKAIDQYEDALEKDIEKTSMLNLSITIKRNFKSTTSSQTNYLDRIEKEDLQFGSDHKLSIFSPPALEIKRVESQQLQFTGQKLNGKSNSYQFLLRSQSDQVNKEDELPGKNFIKVKSFAESDGQSPLSLDNRHNQIIPQSAFSKSKQPQQNQDETPKINITQANENNEKINEQANVYFTKGYLARHKKDYWKAIELYSHAISLKPDFLKAVLNRGFLFDQLGQHEKACEDYTRTIEIDPNCAFAYFNRGISLGKLKKYDKAIQDFSKAIEFENSNSDFYLNRANIYQKTDKHKEAIKDYTCCIDFQTSKLPAVLISRAMSYEKNKESERAKNDYKKAIDLGTNQAQICYSRLATLHFYEDNLQIALALYNKAIELNPRSLYCLAKRAQLYIKLELYKLASEDLTVAISIKDDIDALYYYRGKAFKLMGKTIESTEDLLHAALLNQKDPNIYRLLSKNMLDLNQYEDALTHINKEIELIGTSKQSLFSRAICYNKLSQYSQAEKDLKELLEEDKQNIKLQKSLSICLLNQKKYQEAISHLSSILNNIEESEAREFYKYRSECYKQQINL